MKMIRLILPAVAILATGCVALPVTTTYRQDGCDLEFHKMTLTVQQQQEKLIAVNNQCSGAGGCFAALGLSAVIAAAALPVSAIVSGSIVVVGNSVYWLQERGQCQQQA